MKLLMTKRLIGAILFIPACVIFTVIYVLFCPYFLCDNPAEEDYYNWLNHFDMFL